MGQIKHPQFHPGLAHLKQGKDGLGGKKALQVKGRPLDFSFQEMTSVSDILYGYQPSSQVASKNTAIRLSNNRLDQLDTLQSTFQKIMAPPEQVVWIDLSFNSLVTLDEVITKYPNLRVLYLHANKIESLSQLDKLAALPQLRNLTLHGNPVEQAKGYRFHILSRLPLLKHLDFSAITKQDRLDMRLQLERQARLKAAASKIV